MESCNKHGFTLIELSIVLVIIGLIIGGVLVGKDLIRAASLRSSLSQLEKYTAAANTFRSKYNALPGDISNPAQFGLGTQGGIGTGGNGDGKIFSYRYWDGPNLNFLQSTEIYNFWYHLSQSGLISEAYTGVANTATAKPNNLNGYMPRVKFAANETYVIALTSEDVATRESIGNAFVFSSFNSPNAIIPSDNYFGLPLTAEESYQIDSKVDDGKTRAGTTRAMYPSVGPYWSSGGGQMCDYPAGSYDVLGVRNTSTTQNPPQPESIDCAIIIKAPW